jgi:hypothetical protein
VHLVSRYFPHVLLQRARSSFPEAEERTLVLPSRKVETGATGGSTHLLSWGTSVVVTKNSPPAERATTVARLVPGKPRDEKS